MKNQRTRVRHVPGRQVRDGQRALTSFPTRVDSIKLKLALRSSVWLDASALVRCVCREKSDSGEVDVARDDWDGVAAGCTPDAGCCIDMVSTRLARCWLQYASLSSSGALDGRGAGSSTLASGLSIPGGGQRREEEYKRHEQAQHAKGRRSPSAASS